MDLRERILVTYDTEGGTREQVARRYRVSLGMVKKLIQQRRHQGDISPRHHLAGRKPMIVTEHQQKMRSLLEKKADLTLKELRDATALKCSLQAIHVVLTKMGLTYKKRHFVPPNKTGRTLLRHARGGNVGKKSSIRGG